MLTFYYKKGLYPTTMQGYLNEYVPELYERNKEAFLRHFGLEYDPYDTHEIDPSNMTLVYMLNYSAYLIYDKQTNKIYDLAFESFLDFVWLLQVLNEDGAEFKIPQSVYDQCKKDFKLFSDRVILKGN